MKIVFDLLLEKHQINFLNSLPTSNFSYKNPQTKSMLPRFLFARLLSLGTCPFSTAATNPSTFHRSLFFKSLLGSCSEKKLSFNFWHVVHTHAYTNTVTRKYHQRKIHRVSFFPCNSRKHVYRLKLQIYHFSFEEKISFFSIIRVF